MSPRPHNVRLSISTEQATISVNLTRRHPRHWGDDSPLPDTSDLTGQVHQAVAALESILTRM